MTPEAQKNIGLTNAHFSDDKKIITKKIGGVLYFSKDLHPVVLNATGGQRGSANYSGIPMFT
jgi:hypothetical protein